MRPITLICALVATLQMLSSNALASGNGWAWPVSGPVLTPYRNGGNPYAAGQHRGIDIGARVGTRVVAAVGGTVTFAGVVGSSGLTVSERTADGRFDLSYLHLSAVGVHRGDALAPGAPVGAVGVSGRRSVAAPHLHFGVREAGTRDAYRDPLDFLAPPTGRHVPDPAPTPVPVAHPAAPLRAHRPVVHPAFPRSAPARHPAAGPLPRPHPVAAPGGAARQTRSGQPHPVAHPQPLRGPAAVDAAQPRHPVAAPERAHGAHGGINVGWLVACLAMVAAATALGSPDTTRRVVARGRAGFAGLLRPASRGAE
ncbi:MAG TPA: peptidoglycan DD-metalloendopeptidase family protein [Thermoleophilaceae bacterium]